MKRKMRMESESEAGRWVAYHPCVDDQVFRNDPSITTGELSFPCSAQSTQRRFSSPPGAAAAMSAALLVPGDQPGGFEHANLFRYGERRYVVGSCQVAHRRWAVDELHEDTAASRNRMPCLICESGKLRSRLHYRLARMWPSLFFLVRRYARE